MSRLIDADVLVETLADQIKANESDTSASGMAAKEVLKGFIGLVNGQPSAQPEVAKDTNVPSTDCISRQEAIDELVRWGKIPDYNEGERNVIGCTIGMLSTLPAAQPEQTDCDYCHENIDGYVKPIEKNSHAFIYFGMNGWELNLRAKGWHGSAKIMYCPMCGRRLERG